MLFIAELSSKIFSSNYATMKGFGKCIFTSAVGSGDVAVSPTKKLLGKIG